MLKINPGYYQLQIMEYNNYDKHLSIHETDENKEAFLLQMTYTDNINTYHLKLLCLELTNLISNENYYPEVKCLF